MARFPGETLEQVLSTYQVEVIGYDPTGRIRWTWQVCRRPWRPTSRRAMACGWRVPGLPGSPADSGRTRRSVGTPHVYLLQPFDPDRRIVVMLHGLASSPEAWINVANEVLGDEELRRNYQIWQVYYPTNLPLAVNNQAIREAIEQTLANFDPQGTAKASHDMVLVGHSMGACCHG